jgi:hypothetical protein
MSEETPLKSGIAKLLTAVILVCVLSDFIPHAAGETGLVGTTIEQMQILWNSRDRVDFSSH